MCRNLVDVTSRAEVGMETVSSSFPLICFLSHLSRRGVNGNPMSSGFRGIKQCHLSRRGVNRNQEMQQHPFLSAPVTSHAEVGMETVSSSFPLICFLSHLSRRGGNGNPMSSGFRGIKQCHLSCRGVNRNSCVSGSVAFSIRHLSRKGVNRNSLIKHGSLFV